MSFSRFPPGQIPQGHHRSSSTRAIFTSCTGGTAGFRKPGIFRSAHIARFTPCIRRSLFQILGFEFDFWYPLPPALYCPHDTIDVAVVDVKRTIWRGYFNQRRLTNVNISLRCRLRFEHPIQALRNVYVVIVYFLSKVCVRDTGARADRCIMLQPLNFTAFKRYVQDNGLIIREGRYYQFCFKD
jgi:hypothetical protein